MKMMFYTKFRGRITTLAVMLFSLLAQTNLHAEEKAKPLTADEKAMEESLGLGKKKPNTRGLRTRGITRGGGASEPRKVVTRGGFIPRGGKMVKVKGDVMKKTKPKSSEDSSSGIKHGLPSEQQLTPVEVYADSKAVFNNLLFVINSTKLADQTSYDEINKLARVLKKHPSTRFFIEGHTCDLGADETNLRLSWQRAEAVRLHLIKTGISASRLVVAGFGETELPSIISHFENPEQQEAKRKKARRVVIRQMAE